MRRTQTLILALLTIVILSVSLYVAVSSAHNILGRLFMGLFELRLVLLATISSIIGAIIGYFIGVIHTLRKQNKEN